MVTLDQNTLDAACTKHTNELSSVIEIQIRTLEVCIKYYSLFSSSSRKNFNTEIKNISGSESIIVRSINWFLKPSKRVNGRFIQRNIKSINKLDNFFILGNRALRLNQNDLANITGILNYFNRQKVEAFLNSRPKNLETLSTEYEALLGLRLSQRASQIKLRLTNFIFNYSEFSQKDSLYSWNAYDLTTHLGVRSCLYCNRSYTLSVSNCGKRIIRPELDHFFPKSLMPALALSFYNLIPSCHICNSNLKGKAEFDLKSYFHPYLSCFEKQKVFFTYKPTNATAFYGDARGLEIKLNTNNIGQLSKQIHSNINLFKLDEIYDSHRDIVEGMLLIQKKTNKKNIESIYEKVLVDSSGNRIQMSKDEIYELMVRNYYLSSDFHKRPLSKFERDMAREIGLI